MKRLRPVLVALLPLLPYTFTGRAAAQPAEPAPTEGDRQPASESTPPAATSAAPPPSAEETTAEETTADAPTNAPSVLPLGVAGGETAAPSLAPDGSEENEDEGILKAAASEEVSDAELDAFLSESQLGDGGFEPSLEFSGFADFNYTQFLLSNDDPWRILYNNKGHFGVGNLNVYLDGKLSESVRSFVEVRFTYLPHGSVESLGPPTTRSSNSSSDYTRNERDIRLGGLRIERAYLEWSPHQWLQIKAGHWLTPYGLWNVDHGSPTIVSVTRPFMIDEELLPESQSGLLAEGRFDLTDRIALEYGLGLSNGRGPIDMYYDYDANKGFTGRLKLLFHGQGDLQVGVSGYRGKYTNANVNLAIDDSGLSSSDIITAQFDEQSIAGDIRYTNGGFLFQTEAMLNDVRYTDEGRTLSSSGLTPDNRRWGVYGLTGYRFNWYGVMPYLIGEYSPVPNASIPELPREVLLLGGGLNIRPIAQVVVKLGYDQAILPEKRPNSFDEHSIRRLQGQVAWAF